MENIYERIIEEGIKKISVMAAPSNEDLDLDLVLNRLKKSEDIILESHEFKDSGLNVTVKIDEESVDYIFDIKETFTTPLFRLVHYVPDDSKEEMEKNKFSLYVDALFSENNLKSYLDQLKILTIACPELILIIDYSAEKYVSKEWAFMAIRDQFLPSPSYLYSIQSIVDDNENVWIHTHGLNRCGIIELEIMGANKDNGQLFFPVIESIASRLLDGLKAKPKELIYLGQNIAVTWVPWEEEIDNYGDMIGCREDRENHNDPSGIIYAYKTPNDYEMKNFSHLSEIAKNLEENPVYFYSDNETERMSTLAIGRFNYLREEFYKKKEDFYFLVKMGLKVDEDQVENIGEKEHLWFEITDIDKEKNEVEGILLNEPYGIKDLKEKDKVKKHVSYITDWIIKSPHGDINPDSVYILYYI